MRGLTAAEFFSMPPSHQPQALIDGMVYLTPPAGEAEREIAESLAAAMASAPGAAGSHVFMARDCWLSEMTVLRPEVALVTEGRSGIVGRYLRGAPDIAIHVGRGASLEFDIAYKLPAYLASGVREAWTVDLGEERVTVFDRQGDGWGEGRQTWFGSNVQSAVLGSVVWAGPAGL